MQSVWQICFLGGQSSDISSLHSLTETLVSTLEVQSQDVGDFQFALET